VYAWKNLYTTYPFAYVHRHLISSELVNHKWSSINMKDFERANRVIWQLAYNSVNGRNWVRRLAVLQKRKSDFINNAEILQKEGKTVYYI